MVEVMQKEIMDNQNKNKRGYFDGHSYHDGPDPAIHYHYKPLRIPCPGSFLSIDPLLIILSLLPLLMGHHRDRPPTTLGHHRGGAVLPPPWVTTGTVLLPLWVTTGTVLPPPWVTTGTVLPPPWGTTGTVLPPLWVTTGTRPPSTLGHHRDRHPSSRYALCTLYIHAYTTIFCMWTYTHTYYTCISSG